MKEGDFVSIEFTGRIKDTDEVFDTTSEEMAKLAGIYNEKTNYGPIPIIIGARQLIPGLEDAVKELNVGEKKKVNLASDKAFGEKNPELIKLLPMSVFKDNKMEPSPGRMVNFNGLQGKILSIDGGRVKVDFNHPLAGKAIEYEVEIKEEILESNDKIKSAVRYFTGIKYEDANVTVNGSEATINAQKFDFPKQVKQGIADTIMKWVDGIAKVNFVDTFEKKN
ncbi:MAG: FKBP-type peptidyl-prolyl cis-trans isomerase [Candidatus Aenigmarchaeota archaeon]|nr:FKBP-type peptidyl-prolyl cis-trans isomerase [Candidatus Aenigmarchaeota archaeon]